MTDEHGGAGVEESVEAAWRDFRRRLADRVAELTDEDDRVLVEVLTGLGEDDLSGRVPWVRFEWFGPTEVSLDVGSGSLDERFVLADGVRRRLLDAGWSVDESTRDLYLDADDREVDRLACLAVEVLREGYGVLHPAFLSAPGLVAEPPVPLPSEPGGDGPGGGAVLPRSHDELVRLVDAALGEMTDVVEHDGDGDVPFRAGMSVVFVRVLEDRPAVELFAELVTDPTRPERLPVELAILNRSHDLAKFTVTGTAVRMSYHLVAWPFSGRQLRTVLRRLLEEVDETAEALAERVGGSRFLEEPAAEPAASSDLAPQHPGLVALLELLHLGPVSSPAVAALFEHSRSTIIAHLVGIRTGVVDCGDHDDEQVLTCLRRGLRHVVDGEVPERRRGPRAARTVTEQPSLIDDGEAGEETLDLGWSA